MPGAAIRPHFELEVAETADTVVARLRDRLERPDAPLEGTVLKRHCQLTVRKAQRHFWSPWLAFEVNDSPRGAQISGLFTPHPNVWTGWAALYAIVLFMAVGGLMMGISQWMLDENAWGLWLVPAGVVCGGALWAAALVGQRLGASQMDEIRAFMIETVGPPLADDVRSRHRDDALVLTPGAEIG